MNRLSVPQMFFAECRNQNAWTSGRTPAWLSPDCLRLQARWWTCFQSVGGSADLLPQPWEPQQSDVEVNNPLWDLKKRKKKKRTNFSLLSSELFVSVQHGEATQRFSDNHAREPLFALPPVFPEPAAWSQNVTWHVHNTRTFHINTCIHVHVLQAFLTMRESSALLLRCALFILCPEGEELLVLTVSPLCSWHPCFQSAAKIKCVARFSPFSKERAAVLLMLSPLRCSWLSLTLRRGTRMTFRSSWTPPSAPSPSKTLVDTTITARTTHRSLQLDSGLSKKQVPVRHNPQHRFIHYHPQHQVLPRMLPESPSCIQDWLMAAQLTIQATGYWNLQMTLRWMNWWRGARTITSVLKSRKPKWWRSSDLECLEWQIKTVSLEMSRWEITHIARHQIAALANSNDQSEKEKQSHTPSVTNNQSAPEKKWMHDKRLPWTSSASGANVEIFKLLLHDIVT